jgi:CheY-like chemotaxis protein
VDDISDNLHVARGLLAPYGLQIDTAVSGREAVEKAQSRDYNLIFMDHMMPGMDGIETAAAIRKIDGHANTPIVALTANALRGMKELYLEKGFQDYLSNSLEIEARRLDKLNHYRAAFEMSRTSTGLEIDAEYYRRFTSLVESFDTLPDSLLADRAALIEAGKREDARTIRGTLPAFCENIAAIHRKEMSNEGTENEIVGGILQRLKKAIQNGDTNSAGKTIKEMGAKNLNPTERELYFKLYDSLMEDNAEKALEAIERYLVG